MKDELSLSLATQSKLRTVVSIKTKFFKLWIAFFSFTILGILSKSGSIGCFICIIPDPQNNLIK